MGMDAGPGPHRGTSGARARLPSLLARCAVPAAWLAVVSTASAAAPAATVRVGAPARAPRGATALGAVPATAAVSGAVVLRPRDERGLTRFIGEVTDRRSALFGRYLARGVFARRFGPTRATTEALESQLRGYGLRVGLAPGEGLLMRFSGSAVQVERAFQTGLESYRLADGATGRAATSAAALPAALAGSVAGVLGLSDLIREHPAGLARAGAGRSPRARATAGPLAHPAGSPSPCQNARGAAETYGGLTDDQIANAYGAFGLYGEGDLAAGQRIAVFELEPFAPGDIRKFDNCYFGTAQAASMAARISVTPVDGGQPEGSGAGGEAALDIENVSALAPGASIDVYEAPNNPAGAIDQFAAIISADRDQVVTTSWGDCEQELAVGEPGIQQAENFLFEQAAAQGQTIFAAAGDNGSNDCEAPEGAHGENPLAVDDPGSQPYVVSVGGTTITNAATQPPQEHVWNDGPEGGAGGGGISASWAMPSWQLGATVPGIVLPGSPDTATPTASSRASATRRTSASPSSPGPPPPRRAA